GGPGDGQRDGAQAFLPLAGAGAEAGVALDLLQVGVAGGDGPLHVGGGDVLAAAEDDLAGHRHFRGFLPPPPTAGRANSVLSMGRKIVPFQVWRNLPMPVISEIVKTSSEAVAMCTSLPLISFTLAAKVRFS